MRSSRVARSVDLTPVSPKVKLLEDITDKLKSSRYEALTPQPKMCQSQITPNTSDPFSPNKLSCSPPTKNIDSSEKKRKSNKLELLLSNVKKCNQMSTKAVTSRQPK